MFQNYIADTIKVAKYKLSSKIPNPVIYTLPSVNEGRIFNSAASEDGFVVPVDDINSDFLLNIVLTTDIPSDVFAFAVTWHGSNTPNDVPITEFDVVPIPWRMVGNIETTVLIPRADLDVGERQYAGVVFVGRGTGATRYSGFLRVHSEDYRFLQPSK